MFIVQKGEIDRNLGNIIKSKTLFCLNRATKIGLVMI